MVYKYPNLNISDNNLGIIKGIRRIQGNIIPQLFYYEVLLNKRLDGNALSGFGTSYLEFEAVNKAIGEAFERYSSVAVNNTNFIYGSYDSLVDYNKIDLSDLNYFSDEQYGLPEFPFVKFLKNTNLHWIWGFDLNNSCPILIPSEFAYLNYSERLTTSPSAYYSISTGLACHWSKEKAILNGIFEVIERDSFMITWKRKIEMPRININSIEDSTIKRLLSEFTAKNISVHLIDISMECNIPTVLALALSDSPNMPPLSIDSAASFSYKTAVLKALYGLAAAVLWGVVHLHDFNNSSVIAYHAVYYFDRDNLKNMRFLFKGPSVDYNKLPNIFEDYSDSEILIKTIDILGDKGFNVYYCDITPRDVRKLGYYVTRALIPSMVPLDIDIKNTYNGVKRIYQVPLKVKKYNYSEEINSNIHPFA